MGQLGSVTSRYQLSDIIQQLGVYSIIGQTFSKMISKPVIMGLS